jgi:hypothetical protein
MTPCRLEIITDVWEQLADRIFRAVYEVIFPQDLRLRLRHSENVKSRKPGKEERTEREAFI